MDNWNVSVEHVCKCIDELAKNDDTWVWYLYDAGDGPEYTGMMTVWHEDHRVFSFDFINNKFVQLDDAQEVYSMTIDEMAVVADIFTAESFDEFMETELDEDDLDQELISGDLYYEGDDEDPMDKFRSECDDDDEGFYDFDSDEDDE